jgi:hypothetical protein
MERVNPNAALAASNGANDPSTGVPMPHPSAPANLAPTQLVRRLVLGTAFLIGLAFALAPRTPAVHAQEPKATAPAPKSQSTSKTVTITDGRGQAKIEVKKESDVAAKGSATPGDSADDEDPAAAADKSGSGRGIVIGKHGRIQIDGLPDKEFDSVGDFVHNEPELAGMVVAVVTVVFLAPVLAIALILWYRMRKARMLNETMLKLAEKGIVTSSDALEALAGGKQAAAVVAAAAAVAPLQEQAKQLRRRAAWSDLRKGVFCAGVGLALTLYSLFDDRSPNGIGLVLIFVGAGFLVLWWFEERQLAPPNGAATGAPSVGASSTTSGGSPPPA